MTLQETEEIVKTLEKRHVGLNEAMLVTLLRAGGWEEKTIQEAQMLFRARQSTAHTAKGAPLSLPQLQTEPALPPVADSEHLLLAHNEESITTPEQQSLVGEQHHQRVISQEKTDKKTELPHNLPLRPFETSEHIWPFARYKDVFYGDMTPEVQPSVSEKKQEVVFVKEPVVVSPVVVQLPPEIPKERPVVQVVEKKVYVPVYTGEAANLHREKEGDEKLVIMACVMLLAILLLLGYMYSNGRL